jgi:uncharacterized membrane protein YgcG
MRILQPNMALFLSCCLLFMGAGGGFAYQTAPSVSQTAPQAAQQSPDQLQQSVAPIALYPDALVAQILAGATFPDQIVEAQKWMEQHKDLQGDSLAKAVDTQPWDPSVKALTQFPSVLANMNQNLAWTSELGDAHVNQDQDLTKALQTMRERAKQAGNLKTTDQEKVSTKGNTIVIQPAASDVVYVPQYDPWLVYGDPLAVFPGWYPYPGLFWDRPGIGFGLGFGIGFFGGFGWGWHHWDYDWHHEGRVVYDHNTYISHSRAIVDRNNFHSNYNHAVDAHGRGFDGHGGGRGSNISHAPQGTHSSAFSGFNHGGIARGNASRGQSSFGGFHGGGGGFHAGGGGGFHGGGGGGGHGGGGHR